LCYNGGKTYIARAKVSLRNVSADLSRVDVVADAVVDTLAEVLVADFNVNLLQYITKRTTILKRARRKC
jgi:hypothetical protein